MVFFQFQFLIKNVPNIILDRIQPVVALDRQAVSLILRIEIKPEIALKLVIAREYYVYLFTRVYFVSEISPRNTFQLLQLIHHVRAQDFPVFRTRQKIRQVVLVAFVYGLQPFCRDRRISLLELIYASKYAKILKITSINCN